MVKPSRKIKSLVHAPTTENKATPVHMMPLLVPKTWWHSQIHEQHEVTPPLCFPISFLPVFQNLAPSHIPNTAFFKHPFGSSHSTKNRIFHIHSGRMAQPLYILTEELLCKHFLQTRHLIYIWTAFSVSHFFFFFLREGDKHLKHQSADSFL